MKRACLADFGLASASQSQALQLTSCATLSSRGTLRWQSPELMQGGPSSLATDMYAFACVCYEVCQYFKSFLNLHSLAFLRHFLVISPFMNCHVIVLYFIKSLGGLDPHVRLKHPRHKVWMMTCGT